MESYSNGGYLCRRLESCVCIEISCFYTPCRYRQRRQQHVTLIIVFNFNLCNILRCLQHDAIAIAIAMANAMALWLCCLSCTRFIWWPQMFWVRSWRWPEDIGDRRLEGQPSYSIVSDLNRCNLRWPVIDFLLTVRTMSRTLPLAFVCFGFRLFVCPLNWRFAIDYFSSF